VLEEGNAQCCQCVGAIARCCTLEEWHWDALRLSSMAFLFGCHCLTPVDAVKLCHNTEGTQHCRILLADLGTVPPTPPPPFLLTLAWCSCFRMSFTHSRMSLVPTLVRLKLLLHACDQCHSSRVFTLPHRLVL
jgi:hypothetical protein